jgi:hypothetical protein
MSDLLDLLRTVFAPTPYPAEQSSTADRLRPPFITPVPGAEPNLSGASRDLEVGYNRLPLAYQRAVTAAPPRYLRVGTMPEGYNAKGITTEDVSAPTGWGAPTMIGDSAQTMAHELIHEWARRAKPNPSGGPYHGAGLDKESEEELARLVGGQEPRRAGSLAVERAGEVDTGVKEKYDPQALGALHTLMRYLWSPGRLP